MISKFYVTVAVGLMCFASFASVSDAAFTFGTHTSSDCSNSSMIGWVQGFGTCSAEKRSLFQSGFACYQDFILPNRYYSFLECTLVVEPPTLAPPAGWHHIKYSNSTNCDFSNESDWTAVAVKQPDTYVPIVKWYSGIPINILNVTMSCQNGLLSASACDYQIKTCFQMDNVGYNQCANATTVGGSYSGIQTSCQAAPQASPAANPVAAPVTASTPSKKTNSAATMSTSMVIFIFVVCSALLA